MAKKVILLTVLIILLSPYLLYSKFCHFCGSKIDDTKKICPYCKSAQPNIVSEKRITCPACGKNNYYLNFYCTNSGYPLKFMHTSFKEAVIEFYKKDYAQSLKIFNSILENNKYFYPAIKYKIEILRQIGRFKNYYNNTKASLMSNPADISLLYTMGICYYKNKEKENALTTFQKLLRIYPEFAEVYTEMYEITGDTKHLKKSIKLKPSFYLPYIKLAEISLEQAKYKKIREYIAYALNLFPYDYRIWYIKGRLNFDTKNFGPPTLEYFNKSIKYNPEFIPSHFYVAKLYLHRNNIIDALREFEKIIENPLVPNEILMLSNFYAGKIIDRITNFDLINLNYALKEKDFMKYYKNAFKLFEKIKDFHFTTENEIQQIKELNTMFKNYTKDFIDKYRFLELRRKLFFSGKETK